VDLYFPPVLDQIVVMACLLANDSNLFRPSWLWDDRFHLSNITRDICIVCLILCCKELFNSKNVSSTIKCWQIITFYESYNLFTDTKDIICV